MGKNLYEISVDGKTAKLTKPNRHTLKIVLAKLSAKEPDYVEAGQILLNTCWVEGDKELKDSVSDENAELNISACMAAIGLVELKQTELKKL